MEEKRDGLCRVAIVNNAMEAEMRAALLREEGIDCAVLDQRSYIGAAGMLSGGWFAPRGIYVREEDAERAQELMEACFSDEVAEVEWEE